MLSQVDIIQNKEIGSLIKKKPSLYGEGAESPRVQMIAGLPCEKGNPALFFGGMSLWHVVVLHNR